VSSHAKDPASSDGDDAESDVPSLVDIDDRLALDDFSAALALALQRQEAGADDDDTIRVIRRCERALCEMYVGKLGGFSRRIKVIMTADKMRWLALDHRAGFLVSRIIDPTTVEDMLDICGMPELQALEVLCDLESQEVIELVEGE
jgi:hypothetical protein